MAGRKRRRKRRSSKRLVCPKTWRRKKVRHGKIGCFILVKGKRGKKVKRRVKKVRRGK